MLFAAEFNYQSMGIEAVGWGECLIDTLSHVPRPTLLPFGQSVGWPWDESVGWHSLALHQVSAKRGMSVGRGMDAETRAPRSVKRGMTVGRECGHFPTIISLIKSLPIPITGAARSGRAPAQFPRRDTSGDGHGQPAFGPLLVESQCRPPAFQSITRIFPACLHLARSH